MYANDVAQVNDRVTRLVERLRELGLNLEEDALHPAVMEAETSAGVAAFAREQLAYTRSGRERIAAKFGLTEMIGLEEALALLAMPENGGPGWTGAGAGAGEATEADVTETVEPSGGGGDASNADEAAPERNIVAGPARGGGRRGGN